MKKTILIVSLIFILCACGTQTNREDKIEEENRTDVVEINEEIIEKENSTTPGDECDNISEPERTPLSNAEINALSNDSFGWGFVKKIGAPSEFTAAQREMMAEYDCIYEGDDTQRVLYLTFDEGYENGYTAAILDTLKEKNVKAAFFITGPYLEKNFDLIKRMLDEGHIVGNHTVNHPKMPSLNSSEAMQSELLELDMAFYEAFGTHMTYFRPPEGVYSARSLAATEAAGYKTVLWSFAYRDWERDNQKGKQYAVDSVTPYFYNGSVMLLHAVSSDNAAALGDIIDLAREQGFEFKSLDEYK